MDEPKYHTSFHEKNHGNPMKEEEKQNDYGKSIFRVVHGRGRLEQNFFRTVSQDFDPFEKTFYGFTTGRMAPISPMYPTSATANLKESHKQYLRDEWSHEPYAPQIPMIKASWRGPPSQALPNGGGLIFRIPQCVKKKANHRER